MSTPSSREDTDERLGDAIAEYLLAAESGKTPGRTEFLSLHPEIASELEAFFANHDEASRLSQPLCDLARAGDSLWEGWRFGDYEILEILGWGGMGVVYRARHTDLDRIVALKMIRAGRLATKEDVERFRKEAKAAASLGHPNIVPLHEFGEIDGHYFYTMDLIGGETLDRSACDVDSDPKKAAALMLRIAEAVHHAHQRRIIHRDLKPGNIIVDQAGQPHITDLGLAIHTEGAERLTESNVLLGTLPYMAPEQLNGKCQSLTTAVDTWSLGVILYELLTGKRPFQGKNQIETMKLIATHDPASLREQNPRVSRDLEAICLKCLEKEPQGRYGSTLGLAMDLQRYLRGEPIIARPTHPVLRAWSWCRRNPAGAGLIGAAALLLLTLAVGSAFHWTRQAAQRAALREGLVYTAKFVAEIVRTRFEEWGGAVTLAAQDPELGRIMAKWDREVSALPNPGGLQTLLQGADQLEIQRVCERLHQSSQGSPAYEDWFIVDGRGTLVARTPRPVHLGENFEGRDYFKGLSAHLASGNGGTAHISAAFLASVDLHAKFVVCRPIESNGRFLGMIALALGTHRTMGLHNLHDQDRNVVLVAPWDPARRPNDPPMIWPAPPKHVLLLHPGYRNPSESPVAVDLSDLAGIGRRKCPDDLSASDSGTSRSVSDYVDPFSARDPAYGGSWMAGMAPVGNTGFLVLVQQRDR
jgi:serine/threonine-protein kinase